MKTVFWNKIRLYWTKISRKLNSPVGILNNRSFIYEITVCQCHIHYQSRREKSDQPLGIVEEKQFAFQTRSFRVQTSGTAHRNSSTKFHEDQQRGGRTPKQRLRRKSDKKRGFYRPPAATMVVGRRKLLALVANDRHRGTKLRLPRFLQRHVIWCLRACSNDRNENQCF